MAVACDPATLDPKDKGSRARIDGFDILDRTDTVCQNPFRQRGAPATKIGSLVYRW